MLARRHSKCAVCCEQIEPGDAIQHEKLIGWVHLQCSIGLDDPLPEPPARDYPHDRYPAFKTQRERVDYFQQLAIADDYELYNDPVFGENAAHDIGDLLG